MQRGRDLRRTWCQYFHSWRYRVMNWMSWMREKRTISAMARLRCWGDIVMDMVDERVKYRIQ